MIAKDYFKRQATTLRKMVRVTRNQTIADRLNHMADDFEARLANEAGEHGAPFGPPLRLADHEDDRD